MLPYKDLRIFAVFDNVSNSALKMLSSFIQIREVQTGEKLIKEGDSPNYFYLIIEGDFEVIKTDVETGREHIINRLSKGESFGEISLLDTKPRSATVQAKTNGILYAFSLDNFEKFSQDFPQDYLIIIKNLGKNLSARLRYINDLTAVALTAKLVSAILRVKMGNFIVWIISVLCIYSFVLSFTAYMVKSSHTELYASLLILVVIVIPAIILIKHESFNLSDYGLNVIDWQKNLAESFIFTLPILALVLLIKYILIYVIPLLGNESLFSGPLINYRENTLFFLFIYIISCPIQEFISRGILQSSLQRFLVYQPAFLAILISNLIYSTLHLYLSFYYAIATFIPGLFFGWLYARQNSIVGPTFSHILLGVWSIYIVGVRTLINQVA